MTNSVLYKGRVTLMLKRLFLIWRLRSFTSSLLGSRYVFQKTEVKQTRKAEEWVTEQESDFLVLDHSCIWEEASTSWDVRKKKTFLLWTGQKLGIRNSSKMSGVVPPLWSSYLKATCGTGQAPQDKTTIILYIHTAFVLLTFSIPWLFSSSTKFNKNLYKLPSFLVTQRWNKGKGVFRGCQYSGSTSTQRKITPKGKTKFVRNKVRRSLCSFSYPLHLTHSPPPQPKDTRTKPQSTTWLNLGC